MRLAWVVALLGGALVSADDGRWLDGALVQWNVAGAPLPAPPPAPRGDEFTRAQARCGSLASEAATPAQRAVAAAGWRLRDGASSVRDRVEVVRGFAAFGSQCRSFLAQAFVFVDGRFAGTLSPHAMDPRTDGELLAFEFAADGHLEATYARYLDPNALCCPTRHSRARFAIAADERGAPRLEWLSVADGPEPTTRR